MGFVAGDDAVLIVFDMKNPFTGDCYPVFGKGGKGVCV
jgi:hypothetical protein